MNTLNFYFVIISLSTFLFSCSTKQEKPVGVRFYKETLRRVGNPGDNWCVTWANDNSQITSMDDGAWTDPGSYHNRLFKIEGESNNFTRSEISNYPIFWDGNGDPGWYGYGIVAIDNTVYSMLSLTPGTVFDPFLGVKMVKSPDNGDNWYRINKYGETRYLSPGDKGNYETNSDEMFFKEEFGRYGHGRTAYPFVWVSFVQNGMAASASPDEYIYIYSPESSNTSKLLLARVHEDEFEVRSNWEYFKTWDGSTPVWTNDINQRGTVHKYPEKSSNDEYFGWYSWLPSVVWNQGLGLYIMINGGTYAGMGMTKSESDYYDSWVHVESGSLGFWYSKNPYGPWQQIYYDEHFIVDNENNRTYQPKLSPKWISEDGTKMIMIWSDAGMNDKGEHYSDNYTWNQMEIEIQIN